MEGVKMDKYRGFEPADLEADNPARLNPLYLSL